MSGTWKIPAVHCWFLFVSLRIYSTLASPKIHYVSQENYTTTILNWNPNLPVVGKCCPGNQVLTKDGDDGTICAHANFSTKEEFSPLFSDFNRTGVLVPGDQRQEFLAIYGDPCQYKRYILFPEQSSEDEYYLLLNGSIFAPHHTPMMLSPGVDYCMEIIPELGLRTLVCFPEDLSVAMADSRIKFYASGLLISVPFLVLTVFAYTITPKLRDVHGKALCCYCGSLAVAFTILAMAQLTSSQWSEQICQCIAFVIQFSFVAFCFWLNVLCIETWGQVKSHVDRVTRMNPNRLFFYYSIWAWGLPALLILMSMAMDLSPMIPMTYVKPNCGSETCWFKSEDEAMLYFYVPVGLLLLGNLVLVILTALKITKYQQDLALRRMRRNQQSDRVDQKLFRRLRRTFFVCLVLFLLMSLNWSMELISWWLGGNPLDWSAFDLINALQGLLVFGLFVLQRPPRDWIWNRIQKIRGIDAVEPEVGSMDLNLLPANDRI